MLGYAVDDMIGKSFFEFMDERGVKLAEGYFENRKKGTEEEHEFEFLKKDGSIVYARLIDILDMVINFLT